MHALRNTMFGAILGATMLVAGNPRTADAQVLSVWNFTGNCIDCATAAGQPTYPVTATLTLQDYLGGALADENFVSFAYNGSNLFSAFTAGSGGTFGWNFGKSGNLTAATQTLYLSFGDILEFTMDGNDWALCDYRTTRPTQSACDALSSADFGTGSFAPATTSTVPEPGTYALMAAGLGALAIVRRRRRTTAS
ncbi:MAG: PEP-CTERM sorting domain-containing protein [Gemmatimonadaceae bacterium]|nr:PEP-CTERM sorting domain-containing protein [Gemmatimonadaceae bacterium]